MPEITTLGKAELPLVPGGPDHDNERSLSQVGLTYGVSGPGVQLRQTGREDRPHFRELLEVAG